MKIAIVSKADRFGGGASKVAEDLAKLLNNAGHEIHHYHGGKIDKSSKIDKPLYGQFWFLSGKLYSIFRKFGLSAFIPLELPFLALGLKKERYDIVHFHDISSSISPLSLIYTAKRVTTIWTIHDCSVFTGGCLNPMGCTKYKTDCHACPRVGEWPIDSYLNIMFAEHRLKKKLHRQGNINLLAPSKWISSMAIRSKILKKHPFIISNGVDTNIFKPLDKKKVRDELGLPPRQIIILLSAGNLMDEKKGVFYAIEALCAIKDLNPFILLIGKSDTSLLGRLQGLSTHSTGYIEDENKMNKYYASADIFLNCTLADNQPLVVLETMSAGTPTVGFDTGGIPEVISNNQTGYLVRQKDMVALESALRRVITKKEYIRLGQNARDIIKKKYSSEIFLQKHLDYYAMSVIENKKV